MAHFRKLYRLSLLLVVGAALGCATTPPGQPQQQAATHSGLRIAHNQIGKPYRYGGATPQGFDCSGLVFYSYRRAGIPIPRTTYEQHRRATRISLSQLIPGDLLFFSTSRSGISHVGIYAGNRKFIHAPSSGKQVTYANLDNDYWKQRLVTAGRVR